MSKGEGSHHRGVRGARNEEARRKVARRRSKEAREVNNGARREAERGGELEWSGCRRGGSQRVGGLRI